MTQNEQLIETVASDLKYIQNDWSGRIDQDSLRRGSTTLRRLLIFGDLGKAWRAAGFLNEPYIVAPRLESLLDMPGQPQILLAIAGGGKYEDVTARFVALCEGRIAVSYPTEGEAYAFGLHEFAESCGSYYAGYRIKRREIITYVANKLGGAHFDRGRQEQTHSLLEQNFNAFTIDIDSVRGLNGIYFELLSIGQCISNSPDVQKFMSNAGS